MTKIAIHEYGCTTSSHTIPDIPVGDSVWDDCLVAIELSGYRSGQFPNQAIRRPNAWSNPANNVDNAAASQQYNAAVLANPHVHGGQGPNHRAALGCRVAINGANYQFMKIYIGQFS
jgi:hypothetical protein